MGLHPSFPCLPFQSSIPLSYLPLKTMGCFPGRLMSAASDQKLFCKLRSPSCCSFDEFVEEKVISPSYSSAILTPPPRIVSCLVGRECLLWPVLSLSKTVSLCPVSFCTPRPNLPVTQVSLHFLLLHPSPLLWKGYLFWMLILESLVGLHRTTQLQLLWH